MPRACHRGLHPCIHPPAAMQGGRTTGSAMTRTIYMHLLPCAKPNRRFAATCMMLPPRRCGIVHSLPTACTAWASCSLQCRPPALRKQASTFSMHACMIVWYSIQHACMRACCGTAPMLVAHRTAAPSGPSAAAGPQACGQASVHEQRGSQQPAAKQGGAVSEMRSSLSTMVPTRHEWCIKRPPAA